MTNSDYTYTITKIKQRQYLVLIVDLYLGNRSVTNDIDRIIDEICLMENLEVNVMKTVYKNSDGLWGAYDYNSGKFSSLSKYGGNVLELTLENFYQFFINN